MTVTVELTAAEYARLSELAAEAGVTPGEALKDRAALGAADPPGGGLPADDPYPNPPPHPPEQAHLFADWASWPLRKRRRFQACGVWRDRGDLDLIDDRSGRDRTDRVWAEALSSQTPEGRADLEKRSAGFDFGSPEASGGPDAGDVEGDAGS